MLILSNPRTVIGCVESPINDSLFRYATGYAADITNNCTNCCDIKLHTNCLTWYGKSYEQESEFVHICPNETKDIHLQIPECMERSSVELVAISNNDISNSVSFNMQCHECFLIDDDCPCCSDTRPEEVMKRSMGLHLIAYRDRLTKEWIDISDPSLVEAPVGHEPDAFKIGIGSAFCRRLGFTIEAFDSDWNPIVPLNGPETIDFPPPFSGGVTIPLPYDTNKIPTGECSITENGLKCSNPFVLTNWVRLQDGCIETIVLANIQSHMIGRTVRGMLPSPFKIKFQVFTEYYKLSGPYIETIYRTKGNEISTNVPII